MLVKFSNIRWDTDGEAIKLPNTTILVVDDDIDLDTQGADVLSDKFGWCVFSFEYEIVPKQTTEAKQ